MLDSLNSAVAGLRNFQSKLDVIGNNIANSNTVAYKSAQANFEDTFSQTLQGGTKAVGELQVGSGVQVSAIKNNFTAGSYQQTGIESNLYINGDDGFFVVKDAGGQEFATRAGDFNVDSQGYLVTNQGYRVQGYSDQVADGGTMSTRGDIRIWDDPTTRPVTAKDPNAAPAGFKINSDGRVVMTLTDGTKYDSGQVLLQKFQDVSMLTKEGSNLYSNLDAAGPIGGTSPTSVEPGTNGVGSLKSGALEMSNVDLAAEFANLITTQRGFQANARIITTSDEMLQEVVNLKH
jgi:flagellar hook protein FlgE